MNRPQYAWYIGTDPRRRPSNRLSTCNLEHPNSSRSSLTRTSRRDSKGLAPLRLSFHLFILIKSSRRKQILRWKASSIRRSPFSVTSRRKTSSSDTTRATSPNVSFSLVQYQMTLSVACSRNSRSSVGSSSLKSWRACSTI